jgi:hypothetical protein
VYERKKNRKIRSERRRREKDHNTRDLLELYSGVEQMLNWKVEDLNWGGVGCGVGTPSFQASRLFLDPAWSNLYQPRPQSTQEHNLKGGTGSMEKQFENVGESLLLLIFAAKGNGTACVSFPQDGSGQLRFQDLEKGRIGDSVRYVGRPVPLSNATPRDQPSGSTVRR